MNEDFKSQDGYMIIEVLVSVAIIGLVMAFFAQSSTRLMAKNSEIELLRNRALIRTMLNDTVGCRQLSRCIPNAYIDLLDGENRVVVKADGNTKFGPWQVRAQCRSDMTLDVRIAALNPKGGFRTDPLSQKPLDWNHPSHTIFSKGTLCGKVLGPIELTEKLDTVTGDSCEAIRGTCPQPKESIGIPGVPSKMCCPDGRDMPEPRCPDGKRKMSAYWDRDGDWGVSGNWVVLCQ